MRNAALSGCLGLGFLVAATAGCEPVDDGAATRNEGWNHQLSDHVLPTDRPVYTNVDETETVADGCTKTRADAINILERYCADCHSTNGYAQGLPPWDFVLDPERMKNESWTREGQAPIPFLKVGAPQSSAIYIRAVMQRSMPPIYDLSVPPLDRVTYSEGSVLYQWIARCM
jgi:hypothetical protein